MNIVMVLLLSVSLALDAFAVAVTSGVIASRPRVKHALRIAATFGFFQAVMPVIGWATGSALADSISGIDHWIAFALLMLVGSHMIYEAVSERRGSRTFDPLSLRVLLLLSLATSIDALAAGVSFAFLEIAIIPTVIIIGAVTFFLSSLGYYMGNRIGEFFGNRVKIIGGVILICIGLKILFEHLRPLPW